MGRIVLEPEQLVIGVDTHKQEHVAVAVNGLGQLLGDLIIAATPTGYGEMLAWARGLGPVAVLGVERTGSDGNGLARFLRRSARCAEPGARISIRARS